MGVHLGVWRFIPSHSFALPGAWCDSWASLLACTLASPCLGCKPKVRVATPNVWVFNFRHWKSTKPNALGFQLLALKVKHQELKPFRIQLLTLKVGTQKHKLLGFNFWHQKLDSKNIELLGFNFWRWTLNANSLHQLSIQLYFFLWC
jgi:hypothetical protein